jgi:hypothetical protein
VAFSKESSKIASFLSTTGGNAVSCLLTRAACGSKTSEWRCSLPQANTEVADRASRSRLLISNILEESSHHEVQEITRWESLGSVLIKSLSAQRGSILSTPRVIAVHPTLELHAFLLKHGGNTVAKVPRAHNIDGDRRQRKGARYDATPVEVVLKLQHDRRLGFARKRLSSRSRGCSYSPI